MDISKYFEGQSGQQTATTEHNLMDILKEIESCTESVEDAINKRIQFFKDTYGSTEQFMREGYRDMKKPYMEVMKEALYEHMEDIKKQEHATILAASSIDVGAGILYQFLLQSLGLEKEDIARDAASKAKQIHRQISSNNLDTQTTNIFGALAAIDALLGEITIHTVTEEHFEEE